MALPRFVTSFFRAMPAPASPIAPIRATPTAGAITSGNNAQAIGRLVGALAGGKATQAAVDRWANMTGVWTPPRSPEQSWAHLNLDTATIGDYPPWRLLEILSDLSPEISRALWDSLNMVTGDWSLIAYQPGTQTPHTEAMASLNRTLDRLTERHGAVEVVLGRLFLNALFRGAFFSELVLDKTGRFAVDLVTPDPLTVRFARAIDPEIGAYWRLGQLQDGKFVRLDNRPTVRYTPIHPLPDQPYGRSPLAPSLFPALFMLAILTDTRRVVQQQGWPRLDISIDFDAMLATMPPEAAASPELMAEWAQKHIDDVIAVYAKLPPDAAYVHASTITINKPVGTVDASSLGGISAVITALERMLVRALKTMPLIMGISDGVSEANANRQWEIQLSGLRTLQNHAETMIERQLTLALRAEGIQADVHFIFAENRKAEEQRDEQVRQLKIDNAYNMLMAGWIDQDEAARYAIGHKAAQPAPIGALRGGGAGQANATTQGGNKDATPPKGQDRAERRDIPDRYPIPLWDGMRREREDA